MRQAPARPQPHGYMASVPRCRTARRSRTRTQVHAQAASLAIASPVHSQDAMKIGRSSCSVRRHGRTKVGRNLIAYSHGRLHSPPERSFPGRARSTPVPDDAPRRALRSRRGRSASRRRPGEPGRRVLNRAQHRASALTRSAAAACARSASRCTSSPCTATNTRDSHRLIAGAAPARTRYHEAASEHHRDPRVLAGARAGSR